MTLPPEGYDDDDDDNGTTESLLNKSSSFDSYDEDVESFQKLQIESRLTVAGMRKEARKILALAIPLAAMRLLVAVSRTMSLFFIGRLTSADSLAGAALANSVASVTGYSLVYPKYLYDLLDLHD